MLNCNNLRGIDRIMIRFYSDEHLSIPGIYCRNETKSQGPRPPPKNLLAIQHHVTPTNLEEVLKGAHFALRGFVIMNRHNRGNNYSICQFRFMSVRNNHTDEGLLELTAFRTLVHLTWEYAKAEKEIGAPVIHWRFYRDKRQAPDIPLPDTAWLQPKPNT